MNREDWLKLRGNQSMNLDTMFFGLSKNTTFKINSKEELRHFISIIDKNIFHRDKISILIDEAKMRLDLFFNVSVLYNKGLEIKYY